MDQKYSYQLMWRVFGQLNLYIQQLSLKLLLVESQRTLLLGFFHRQWYILQQL
jgi:hypothetical protein